MSAHGPRNPAWSLAVPPAGFVLLGLTWGGAVPGWAQFVVVLVLVANVVVAVHHAEMVAARVGEPFGTLVLAVSVTVIEVALILTLMIGGSDDAAALARDTVFAAVMIIYNGVLGVCLLVGTLRHRVQTFHPRGAAGALGAVTVLVTLTLVLPSYTRTSEGRTFSTAQLLFMSGLALGLYGTFVFFQAIRHRHYFLPEAEEGDGEADKPPTRTAWTSFGALLVSLVTVVGLAKVMSPTLKDAVAWAGAPVSSIGVVIALLVLAPETMAAVRAAAANRLQTSMNLAFGSAMASIGLTIPAIAVASLFLDVTLTLGLATADVVLLALTVVTSVITLQHGRVTVMQGAIHLTTFAAFLFLAVVP